MIIGAHAIVFSSDAEDVRTFFRDVLGLSAVDAGGGWLIFAMATAELAAHPATDAHHEIYLMCDDIHATVRELEAKGVTFTRPITKTDWGHVTRSSFPMDTSWRSTSRGTPGRRARPWRDRGEATRRSRRSRKPRELNEGFFFVDNPDLVELDRGRKASSGAVRFAYLNVWAYGWDG